MQQVIEALERAQAAIWDSHYGHGLSVEYARRVSTEIDAALAALAALRSQPTADEWPNRECALDDQSQCLEAARRIEAMKREREEIAAALEPFRRFMTAVLGSGFRHRIAGDPNVLVLNSKRITWDDFRRVAELCDRLKGGDANCASVYKTATSNAAPGNAPGAHSEAVE